MSNRNCCSNNMAARPRQINSGTVSSVVAQLRKAHGMTQQAFSNHLGVALNTVARWETVRVPDKQHLLKLAEMATLIGREDISDILRLAALDEDGVMQAFEAFQRMELLLGLVQNKLFYLTSAFDEFRTEPLCEEDVKQRADEIWKEVSEAKLIAKRRGLDASKKSTA